jgi:1-acyl-sn-glycerol-3-phosphate acyltransferase
MGVKFMRNRKRGSILRFLRPLMGSLKVTGNTKNLPSKGVLVIINHTSVVDPVLVYIVLRRLFGRKVSFMATAGLWKIPIFSTILRRGNHIPVYRRTPNAAGALQPAGETLLAGGIVAMYPEGGIPLWKGSEDRLPSRIKTGAARLWQDTKVPIIPIAQLGARRVVSGGKLKRLVGAVTAWFRRPRLHVHVGEPIYQEPTGDLSADTVFLKDAIDRVWEDAKRLAS